MHYIVGAVIVIAIIAFWWLLHRWYKGVGRRCDGINCGNSHVKRVCKILLPPDEIVSWRSPAGKWRWFIRRPVKLTFSVCERTKNHNGAPRVKLVKIDRDPISIWHAFWVKWFHKEQYFPGDPFLPELAQRELLNFCRKGNFVKLDPQASDTPPLSLWSLFQDYLEETSKMAGNGSGENPWLNGIR